MRTNIATAATSPALIPAAVQPAGGKEYTDEEVRRLVAALEEPFDPREIKWRVTNTTKDRSRGQMIAYADSRAYTDRLNAVFTVRGWTRKYGVEMINNVERKTSRDSESQMVGKVVVTCEVSIYGLERIPVSEKSGPITRTPARRLKRKRSSGLAPVSV
jgi:hypothetical protein